MTTDKLYDLRQSLHLFALLLHPPSETPQRARKSTCPKLIPLLDSLSTCFLPVFLPKAGPFLLFGTVNCLLAVSDLDKKCNRTVFNPSKWRVRSIVFRP